MSADHSATQHGETDTDVVIVGGGLAGLVAAAYVARAGHSVTVLERRGRLGGLAVTDERDGFLFNQGPHALYRGGPAEESLVELGVLLAGGPPRTSGGLWIDGAIARLPGSPGSLMATRALGVRDKVDLGRLFVGLPRLDPTRFAGVTVADWIDGALRRDRSRLVAHAMVRLATYGHDPDVMSADVAISQLQRAVRHGVVYLDGGWGRLADQLRVLLGRDPRVRIATHVAVAELPDARSVIIAGGGPEAAQQLLGRSFDVGPASAATCLDLGLDACPARDFVLGVDEPVYFSNHSAAADLAPAGRFATSMIRYVRSDEQPGTEPFERFLAAVELDRDSIVTQRRLHRMTTSSAIPTAALGGLAGRPQVDATGHDHVMIVGDWIGPEGHLLDASLASARAAAVETVARLERRRTVA